MGRSRASDVVGLTQEDALLAAGLSSDEDSVEILRDGFPSFVARVKTKAYPGHPLVIVKAVTGTSLEGHILSSLGSAGFPVPAVLSIGQAGGTQAIVMEDVGSDALWHHPDPLFYAKAAEGIARIQMRAATDLSRPIPRRDPGAWEEVISSAVFGTTRCVLDRIYKSLSREELAILPHLQEETLGHLGSSIFPDVPIHGDYHEGNILLEAGGKENGDRMVIVDWGDARWDSGFIDPVCLCDVAGRMGTCNLDSGTIMEAYVQARCDGGPLPRKEDTFREWNRCVVLRAWDELKWFTQTGDDYGDRAKREISILCAHIRRL